MISIHTNATANPSIIGIETFCHKPELFSTNFHTVPQELFSYAKDTQYDLMARSQLLAHIVHRSILDYAKIHYPGVVDRKVRHRVARLLLGAEVPSILVELGFLTNKKEAQLLQSEAYQKLLAQGISKGLDEFFNVG